MLCNHSDENYYPLPMVGSISGSHRFFRISPLFTKNIVYPFSCTSLELPARYMR